LRVEGKPLRAIADTAQAKGHKISHEGVRATMSRIDSYIGWYGDTDGPRVLRSVAAIGKAARQGEEALSAAREQHEALMRTVRPRKTPRP
jgi:hypothetical protein